MDKKAISDFLKSKRKSLNLSVKEVLDKLRLEGIDISPKTLYGWEGGHSQPDADTFAIILKIYDVQSIQEVLRYSGNSDDKRSETSEEILLSKFRKLNEEGQEKLLDYADDLMSSGKYKKTSSAGMAKEA